MESKDIVESKGKQVPGYVKPQVTDYGDLQELTSTHTGGAFTDVPLGGRITPSDSMSSP